MKKGDRVLLYMQNAPQFTIAYYAILHADAVVVPVNPMNHTVELILPAEVQAPVQAPEFANDVAWCEALMAGHVPIAHSTGLDDLCVFPYSSGTTGAPKGCTHTHRSAMRRCCSRRCGTGTLVKP